VVTGANIVMPARGGTSDHPMAASRYELLLFGWIGLPWIIEEKHTLCARTKSRLTLPFVDCSRRRWQPMPNGVGRVGRSGDELVGKIEASERVHRRHLECVVQTRSGRNPGTNAQRAWSSRLLAGHGTACDACLLRLLRRPTWPRPDRRDLPSQDDGSHGFRHARRRPRSGRPAASGRCAARRSVG
jgi:hypothetical protein